LWDSHGYGKDENNELKRPCNECDCKHFQQSGTQTNIEVRARLEKIAEGVPVTDKETADLEEFDSDDQFTKEHLSDSDIVNAIIARRNPMYVVQNMASILGPYWAGIYWGKRKNKERHNNDKLTQLLYHNKRYKDTPPLSSQALNYICDLMYNKLQEETLLDNIGIIVPVPNYPESNRPEPRCASSIAAGLVEVIRIRNRKNCNSYNDILERISNTKSGWGRAARREAAEKDYDIAEDIKTAENSRIKDQIVLLIDDIKTSGATCNVCAKLLVDYGAKQVIILCAAETKLG
jgi:predicted amidophosphoribosyltransferase